MTKILFAISAAIGAIHLAHALTLDRKIQYLNILVKDKKISNELNGCRIAFITDTHSTSAKTLRSIVKQLNNKTIDLLLLGGDYHKDAFEMWRTMEILSSVQTNDGIFGIEGNHDNPQKLQAAMNFYGIRKLNNTGIHVRPRLFVGGTSCIRRVHPLQANISDTVASAKADDFVILLTHEPDTTMKESTKGIDLILSGHTHGGQVTLFGIWAPALTLVRRITKYGQRFMSGWAKSADDTTVFVSNGVGHHLIRIFSRPQVVVFELKTADI